MSFLNSVLNQSKKYQEPFQHWELNEPLSSEAIKEINTADIANVVEHNLSYDGTRAIDGGAPEFREGIASGGKAIKFRCFVTKDNQEKFPALVKLIREAYIEKPFVPNTENLNQEIIFKKIKKK